MVIGLMLTEMSLPDKYGSIFKVSIGGTQVNAT